MRVLVVDDELVSRKKMNKIMETFSKCVAADSGEAALKAFEGAIEKGEPFDLITLDVSMPRMNGTEVLYEIRKIEQQRSISKENQSKVIMVTALADKDTVTSCVLAGCDSYVIKPFDKASIAKRLKELGMSAPEPVQEGQSIRKMVMETIHKFNQGEIRLPVLPQISREIETTMSKPTSGAEELTKIIEKDAVISLKIIDTANSALYYRGGNKVQDLRTAIIKLGTNEIQSIVSAITSRGLFETKKKQFKELVEKLWLHSLSCAYCCRTISLKIGDPNTSKTFLMGLTHDIGSALLLKSISDIAPDTMEFDRNELMESLQEVSISFGAALLEEWGYGSEFSEVVRLHKWNSFEKETKKEILIVNLAEKVSSKIQYGFFESDADLSKLESARILRIDEKALEEVAEEVKREMKEVERVFH